MKALTHLSHFDVKKYLLNLILYMVIVESYKDIGFGLWEYMKKIVGKI